MVRRVLVTLLCAALGGCFPLAGATPTLPHPEDTKGVPTVAQAYTKEARILKAARQWILDNSGGYWRPARGKIFPAPDDGEKGLGVTAASRDRGKLVAEFSAIWRHKTTGRKIPFVYDSARHLILIVETSQDEPVLYVAAFDRLELTGTHLGTIEVVDLSSTFSQDDFSRLFPKLGEIRDVSYDDVIADLYLGGSKIKLL